MCGCSNEANSKNIDNVHNEKTAKNEAVTTNNNEANTIESIVNIEEINNIYFEVITASDEIMINSNNISDEVVHLVVNRLGAAGYVAVDGKNKVNMTCSDKLLDFINKKNNDEKATVQVVNVLYNGEIAIYNIITDMGEVTVQQFNLKYENNKLNEYVNFAYEVSSFKYTEEGYLLIGGSWYSTQSYVLSLSDQKEHIALRVLPLEDRNRELCEKYIEPVSYSLNNMFITNWNETDYGSLDFYDIFENNYENVYGKKCPYVMDEDLSVRKEYEISAEEFENVIKQYIDIDEQKLRDLLKYNSETNCYIFIPRGFHEFDYACIPSPEVVAYTENEDGSITMLVNAVYPNDDSSKLFSHKTTVKELDGKIYYISNEYIENENTNLNWHADRFK